MDYKKGSFDLNNGYQKTSSGDWWYHTSPPVGLYVEYKVTRNSQSDSKTYWEGRVYSTQRSDYSKYNQYNGELKISLNIAGTEVIKDEIIFSGDGVKGHTYTDSISFNKEIDIPSDSTDINIYGDCSFRTDCNHDYPDGGDWVDGYREDTKNVEVPTYSSSTPATNASNGKIYSTNNNSGGTSGRNISDKPDNEVWFNWDGAIGGTPDSVNGIKQYNVDISKTNSESSAGSISITQNYSKNTHLSLFTLCRSYGARVGDTLYCWVNTQTKNDAWLGRVYLGSITLRKDGHIYYKDSNGTVHECTKGYLKDSSGNTQKSRYAKVKDGGGATRIIDVYTTLYE